MTDRPNPARVVADADVLAADLLVGGSARAALDHVRSHSWVELVATEELLDDAEAIIAELTNQGLATTWRARVEPDVVLVEQPRGDHPALAAAYHGEAAHVLTFDESLTSARAGTAVRKRVATSVKQPDAFAQLFDPDRLYPVVADGDYPGSDRDPRA